MLAPNYGTSRQLLYRQEGKGVPSWSPYLPWVGARMPLAAIYTLGSFYYLSYLSLLLPLSQPWMSFLLFSFALIEFPRRRNPVASAWSP